MSIDVLDEQAVSHLGKVLGEGARFVVYEAFLADNTRVAAKTVAEANQHNLFLVERDLEKEGEVLALLEHPSIPSVYGLWRSPRDRRLHLIMDLAKGVPLETVISICKQKRRYEGARNWDGPTQEIVRQVGDALAHVHACGVYHNDLKPDNILVDFEDGVIKVTLIDFDSSGDNSERGRFEYAAPERIDGKQPSAKTDLYSFAVVIYKLMTGTLPFRQTEVGESRNARFTSPDASTDPIDIDAWNYLKTQDQGLADALKQALQADPAQRPANVLTFLEKMGLSEPKKRKCFEYVVAAMAGLFVAWFIAFPQGDSLLSHRLLDRPSTAFCYAQLGELARRACLNVENADGNCPQRVAWLNNPAECSQRVKRLAACINVVEPREE